MKNIFAVMILFVFCSCSGDVSQIEYDDMVAKNKLLNKRIEQLKSEMSDDLFGDNDNDDFKEIDNKEEPKKAVEDIIPAKSFTGIGIWKIDRYVDEFGDYTNEYHVRNDKFIKGKFSNSATDGSALNALLLITSKEDSAIKLWEYDTRPVKTEHTEKSEWNKYIVSIKGKNNVIFKLEAYNFNDRLKFDKENALKFHKMLMKGTVIKVRIKESESNTTYNFEFQADGYDNIYDNLKTLQKD